MNILVTGNLGYVGPCVIAHLRAAFPEARLTGLDAGYFADALLDPFSLPDQVPDEQIMGDVRDFDERRLNGITGVVHLAGISNDPIGNQFEDVTRRVNYEATVALAAKHHVEMPITHQVHRILEGEVTPREAIRELMERSLKEE